MIPRFTIAILAASSVHAGVIFSDDFSGGSGDLDASTPDTTTGAVDWVASSAFNQDGSIDQGQGSATLAFSPVDGRTYTLDASVTGVSGDGNWLALGFCNGQSTSETTNDRFITGNVVGTAWMFVRGDASGNGNRAFVGTGALGSGNNGLTSGADWTSLANENPGGDMDMRIVLDTTGGAGTWTATFFAKLPADGTYTEVRAAAPMESESFDSVGLAIANTGVFGTFQSFTLSEDTGADTIDPSILSLAPSDDATDVPMDMDLSVTFTEPVVPGTGNISIRRSLDDSLVESFDVTSPSQVSIAGADLTINPSADLDPGTEYYVQIDATAIEDASGNGYAGIVDTTSWSFSTTSPVTGLAPYTADPDTLHLWHFDEVDPGPAAPASGIAGSFNLAPVTGATLGASGFPGFGTAGDTSDNENSGFQGGSVGVGGVTGAGGAFTYEAMIRVSEISSIQQIISLENGGSATDRPFQFRIESGQLKFINIAGGGSPPLVTIPTTGPDAFVANEWFHVAVTYDGNEDTADNFKFYWTRVDVSRNEASELASGNMGADLAGNTSPFGVGSEYRGTGGFTGNIEGQVDEVRISGVAREADEFFFLAPDVDMDGLADPWELIHFRDTPQETDAFILAKYDGTDDPDGDTYDNEAEETAGTDPNNAAHTPFDADQDGYEDAWELSIFDTTAYGPTDDPDGDGFSTADELVAGTDPADSLSNPDDTDGDGLDDDTEIILFGDLSQGPLDDFDGDGISNQAELTAGTDPTDPTDFPPVSFIPVTDANGATDENGYAGSAINSIAFAQNNLITIGNQQIISYYRRHATDSGDPTNNTVLVARRNVGDTQWEIFPTNFTSFNINDTHNVISCAIDGDGFLHMSWGMHVHPLLYAKSTTPVTGSDPIVMQSLGAAGMTGQENGVTYPKFQTLPDGDVIFLFREGGSGRGDWFLHRYDTDTDTWSPIHDDGNGNSQPLMLGRGDSPDNCFYPDRMTLGPDGMLHLSGVFRYNGDSPAGESGYQTNHRYVYLGSPNGGTTWQRTDGSQILVPIVEDAGFQNLGAAHVPEIVEDIPEGHSNMNESGMTTDSAGNPIIANWWAVNALSGDHTRQYHIFFHDGTSWHRRTVSDRDIDNPATKYSEGQLGSSKMGRPVVLTDADDRIIVVYNDNRFPGITVVFSQPLALDPGRNNWTRMNITTENLGNWEATYDEERWKQDGVLQMIYQQLPGMGASYGGQNNSTPVSVVEWNANAYFNSPIRWRVDTKSTPGQAIISARTRFGLRYDLKTSTDLQFSDPPTSTLTGDGTWQEFGSWPTNEQRRFWRVETTEESTNDL